MSSESKELVSDTMNIVNGMTEREQKKLVILLLADLLHSDPEKAMRAVVMVKESEQNEA